MNSRLSVITIVILVFIVGCGNISNPPSDQTYKLNSDLKASIKLTTTEERSPQDTSTATIPPKSTFTTTLPEDVTWKMLGEVNFDRALTDLKRLTGEEQTCTSKGCFTINSRWTGSEGLSRAKDYLLQELTKLDYSVSVQDWSRSNYTDQNIIATKLGQVHPEERIYFVAHVDGYSPGADDNAGGVVDILELARVLSSYSFERTIVLFFSTGEENGSLGVVSYLIQLTSAELATIKDVINIDMIGYDGNNDRVMELFHGDHPPTIALTQMIKNTILAYHINLVPLVVPGCG